MGDGDGGDDDDDISAEPEPLDKARRHYAETRDPASTLAMLPRRRCVEGKLLWGLKERSGTNDLQGAFNFVRRGGGERKTCVEKVVLVCIK